MTATARRARRATLSPTDSADTLETRLDRFVDRVVNSAFFGSSFGKGFFTTESTENTEKSLTK